ncbi:alanine racemase [Ferrovibrio sp.]|uniref:alanine racemase n=1 Tax=Ferrovibrio sp. TaxID=1917215 RepID=UPI001B68E238|nr:alanine racemase [Ferrovibrio sp.]MBP7064886.1 alanine racemase [Ferrovibrio sp.]
MYTDTAILTIDLGALVANWRHLAAQAPQAECAAVVKADGYGLGAAAVATALYGAGCRRFFVAHPQEAITLRQALNQALQAATESGVAAITIHCLHGVSAGAEADFVAANIVPVLSTPEQITRWQAEARRQGRALPAALQADTGMNRLGLQPAEVDALLADPARLDGLALQFVMTHLACADEPQHAMNEAQRQRFAALRARFPGLKGSLANSAGIFLGPDYQHDILRPGIALYGASPAPGITMREVVRLEATILQIRDVDSPGSVGYGAAYRVEKPGRIATLAVGYADGFLRALSNRGFAAIKGLEGDVRVPLVGRVSMDMITLDVSALPEACCQPGTRATLLGGAVPLDEQAAHAGTIAYELLTDLGRRYQRVFV